MDRKTKITLAISGLLIVTILCILAAIFVGLPFLQQGEEVANLVNTPQPPTVTVAEAPEPECTVLERLNLRQGPGVIYDPPITTLPTNALLIPLTRNEDGQWIQVQVSNTGQLGWVNRPYLDCDSDVSGLPLGTIPPTPTTIPATATPIPTPTPTLIPSPSPTNTSIAQAVDCEIEPPREFKPRWNEHKGLLGCPSQPNATGGLFVEQQFEKGGMFWVGELDWFFVNMGSTQGRWFSFQDEAAFDAQFNPNHDGATCEPDQEPATGLIQPIRGFGAIWCGAYKGINFQETLGFAIEEEHGELNNLILAFEDGYMLRSSDNHIYIYFKDSDDGGAFIRR